MSAAKLRAKRIDFLACSKTWSGVMRNFFSICNALVAKKTWMRFALAALRASDARVMSFSLARAKEHTMESFTAAATAEIASKSPSELAAKPASITSTLRRSS